jgi:hypothetical protein
MRPKSLIATLLGITIVAGPMGASFAGDVAPSEATRASLTEATRAETQANDALRDAVAARDSAQIALQTALEQLNEAKLKLSQMPANNSDRAAVKHTAAKLRHEINARLFAALDVAKDKVTTARQAAEKAQAEKQAVEAELLGTSVPGDPPAEVAIRLSARR